MGGAETLITNYAHYIDNEKIEMIIVTLSKHTDSINEKRLAEKGIKVVFLGDNVVFPNSTSIFKSIIRKIHKYYLFINTVYKLKPQVIHTHLGVNHYILPLKVKKNRIKLYHTLHSDINALFGEGRLKNKLITKYCIKRKGMVPIALHSQMQREVNKLFNINNTMVVPNGIDLERFTNIKNNKASILESLNIKKDAFIVGHVGRFSKTKNHSFLIEVFANLIRERSDAHLLLIGSGELENKIRGQIDALGLQKNVSFLGNREDIPELMSVMDVFVFPSFAEGFGNVLIEAQTVGVRCVVSDSVPGDAFITNLATPLSLDDPIEKWISYINTPCTSEEIEKNNLLKYDIRNIVRNLEKVYLS